MLSITALLSTRNEWPYLGFLLDYLEREEIDVFIIDNASMDQTRAELERGRYSNVKKIDHLPYTGVHDQSAILEAKMEEAVSINEGWIINHDSDEVMQSIDKLGGLREEIELADERGFNAINLHEIVMLPLNPELDSYRMNNLHYYFFEPEPMRLVRIWKAGTSGSILSSGGHRFEGDNVRISDRESILRHYIVRSQKHALDKYLTRQYSQRDLQRGWHGNRLGMTEASLDIPKCGAFLKRIPRFEARRFDLSAPTGLHYWQWRE